MKQSQKGRPREPPKEPMLRVATAMFALNLLIEKGYFSGDRYSFGYLSYQNVAACQNLVVFCCRSSSVTRSMPPSSMENLP